MITAIEQETGITFAELGIELGRLDARGYCKAICPECAHLRKPENQKVPKLHVNTQEGTWRCHHCGWVWGLKGAAHRRGVLKPRRIPGGTRLAQDKPEPPPIKKAAPVAVQELPDTKPAWMYQWFAERGITAHTVDAFGCTAHERNSDGQQVIHFPYYVDGKLVNVKRRILDPKDFRMVQGADKALFNVDRTDDVDRLVLVEGEPDVMACHEVGWTAVTLPNGAPGRQRNKETGEVTVSEVGAKLDGLREAKSAAVIAAARRVVIATDGDLEGQKLAESLIEHVGPERCWRVTWPEGCKDANDVLVKLGAQQLDDVLSEARPVDLPGITDFMDEYAGLLEIYHHGYDKGLSTGWENFDPFFTIRLGTLTTISGVPGNGKTSWVHSMFANLAHLHDMKFGVFSPESGTNGSLFAKLVQITADAPILPTAQDRMSLDDLESAAHWVAKHFWRVDATHTDKDSYAVVTLPEVITRLEKLVIREGIQGAIIDPWNRIEAVKPQGVDAGDYHAWAINMLTRFAQRHMIALFVICHPTKMPDAKFGEEEPIPSPYNIMGSSHWYNMSDQILGIGRNKFTEPLNRATVQVQKIREEGINGQLGTCHFYYDGRSRRFVDDEFAIPAHVGSNPYMPLRRSEPVLAMPAAD